MVLFHLSIRFKTHGLVIFFSIDPLAAGFPWNSPYAFNENRSIDGREMERLEVVLQQSQSTRPALLLLKRKIVF